MKYCMHCGKECHDEAVVCPNCGCSVQYDNQITKQNQNRAPQLDSYSPMSVIGFVFAFLSPLVGLIISIIAHGEAGRTGSGKSLSFAKAGIIISAVFLGLEALVFIPFFISMFAWIV